MKDTGKQSDIFRAAHQLFMLHGYDETTIRDISRMAGVSMGLPNHFFGSKWELAAAVLFMVTRYAGEHSLKYFSLENEPLLWTSLDTRLVNAYLLRGPYRAFYRDCLTHDVFFRTLNQVPNVTIYALAAERDIPVDDDIFLLYGKYVPYSVEKTLVLNKERGLFPTIPYDDIPDYIIRSKLEHFVEKPVLDTALRRARALAEEILPTLPMVVPDEVVEASIARLN